MPLKLGLKDIIGALGSVQLLHHRHHATHPLQTNIMPDSSDKFCRYYGDSLRVVYQNKCTKPNVSN